MKTFLPPGRNPAPGKSFRTVSPLRYLALLAAVLILLACLFLRVCIPDSTPKATSQPLPRATQVP